MKYKILTNDEMKAEIEVLLQPFVGHVYNKETVAEVEGKIKLFLYDYVHVGEFWINWHGEEVIKL